MPASIKQAFFNQVTCGEGTPGRFLGLSLSAGTGLAGQALEVNRRVESEARLRRGLGGR